MYTVEQAPRELNFGRQGESNILSYQFDFSQWAEDWPGGLASMTVILPNQTQPQPIPDTQAVVDGTIITLHVLDNLTEKDGRGTLIIRYVAGTNKKRSRLIEFVVRVVVFVVVREVGVRSRLLSVPLLALCVREVFADEAFAFEVCVDHFGARC